jgi:hypothetical protein
LRILAPLPYAARMADISKARTDLKQWLDDMAALKPWADVGNPESQPFVDALAAARAKALAAAAAYAAAAGNG